MKQGRKIRVPPENRTVATRSQRPQAPNRFLTLSDGINNFGDAISVVMPTAGGVEVADSFSLSDNLSLQLTIVSDLADSILIGDNLLIGFGAAVEDALSLSDASVTVLGLRIELADAVTLSDDLALSQLGHYLALLEDSQSLSDSLELGYGLLPSDQIVLADQMSPLMAIFTNLADSLPQLEEETIVIPHGLGLTVERSDQLEQFDAINLFSAGFKTFAETLTLSDAYTQRSEGFLTFSDSLSQSDALAIVMGERLAFAENAANLADGVASVGQIWEIDITQAISQSDNLALSNDTIAKTVSVSDSINNWNDAFGQKMPRWRDSIATSTINTSDVPLTLSDSITTLADAVATGRVQFLAPSSDVTVGLWSATPLWQKIDESAASDADLIVSATNPANDTCETGLNAATDPVSSVNHVLSYRYKKSANAGRQIDLTVRLIQGTTILATFTHTNIGNTVVQADQTLTGTQADSITNYGDLRIRFSANAVGSGTGRAGQITWAQFRCPK